ncbi:hypothetical protein C8R43DRAFT_969646 [Mycena crocata]|nr:hypothetical protein C8R43DRAFT_969646 [Mycena crocata]
MVSAEYTTLRQRLADTDSTIYELRLRLKTLEDTREDLQRQLDGIFYPVLTLPHEITSHIFLHSLPSLQEELPMLHVQTFRSRQSQEPPLLLLQVCRAWRSIALSTPRLWAQLHLDLMRLPKSLLSVSGLEMSLDTWFNRAGSCPLSLAVLGWGVLQGLDAGIISTALARRAPKLQCLILGLDREKFNEIAGIGPFPLLEKLVIGCESMPEENEESFQPAPIFHDAPRLTCITLSDDITPSMLSLPYAQLSTLTCEMLTGDEFMALIRDTPLLTEFTCSVSPDTLSEHTQLATHGHIQTLRLIHDCSTCIFQFICFPSLQNLHLVDTEYNAVPEQEFLPFLTASAASLRRFSTGMSMRGISADWFTAIPGLTSLELFAPRSEFLVAFFTRLDRGQDRGFLPHLQYLTFTNFNGTFFDADIAIPALSSRCAPYGPSCSLADDGAAALLEFRATSSHGAWFGEKIMIPHLQGLKIHVGHDEVATENRYGYSGWS